MSLKILTYSSLSFNPFYHLHILDKHEIVSVIYFPYQRLYYLQQNLKTAGSSNLMQPRNVFDTCTVFKKFEVVANSWKIFEFS